MTIQKLFTTSLFVAICFVGLFSIHISDAASLSDSAKSTWLWNTTTILSTRATLTSADKTNVANLITFCKQKGVTELYLQINRDIAKSKYQYLISQLKAARVTIGTSTFPILVQALDGSSTWITPDGDVRRVAFFDWVTAYQTASTASQRFSGIHLDVEPYTNSLWTSNQAAAILAYQNFVLDAKNRVDTANTAGLDLGLTFDIPFWFDGTLYNNILGQGNLTEWLYQTVPSLAIMAYRDSLDGNYGGMWSITKDELTYGKLYGKKTIIGAETSLQSPTYISFYEEGQAAMLTVFAGLAARITTDATTTGADYSFAVHDYKNWKTIKP